MFLDNDRSICYYILDIGSRYEANKLWQMLYLELYVDPSYGEKEFVFDACCACKLASTKWKRGNTSFVTYCSSYLF